MISWKMRCFTAYFFCSCLQTQITDLVFNVWSEKSHMSSASRTLSWGGRDATQSEYLVKCHHKVFSKPRIVKSGANRGQRFHGCALWPKADCSFFQWVADYPPFGVDDYKKRENDRPIYHVDDERSGLEEKIAKLKMKTKKLKEKNEELLGLVCKHAKGEKYSFMALIVSWIVFVVVLYGK
ncbi:unnamed protein product [Cuscuta epithymum]|uniref:GRF-type domain-containing protein n=1 Tax=Cuscuta epithymum TaxID=186058 RepID=A0AAV0C734_9ASTE|nr:unnamed protein product [Cuscuta epithymum]